MQLRPLIFWPHLVAGVLAGAVILLMSVTGVLLTYERQMIAWSDSHMRSTPPSPDARKLPVETVLAKLRETHPEITPNGITMGAAADAPVMLAVPQKTLYADAYTGALLGEGTTTVRRAMGQLRAWHRWIAMEGESRPMARAITGWSNVLFAFIVLSGLYLWLPKVWAWTHFKAVTLFKPRARGKVRDFNWHHVFGIWSAIPLFIVVISAVPISFPWGNAMVYRLVGEEVPRPQGGREGGPAAARGGGPGARAGGAGARAGGPGAPGDAGARRPEGARPEGARAEGARAEGPRAEGGRREGAERGEGRRPVRLDGLNALVARAERQVDGWRTINMRMPANPQAPVVFAIDKGDGGQPHLRSTLTLDRRSGDVVSYESFSDLTLGRRIRNIMRFAHTGEVLGIPGQTIAGLVTFAGVMLVWTGIALALRRFAAWLRRRTKPEAASMRSSAA